MVTTTMAVRGWDGAPALVVFRVLFRINISQHHPSASFVDMRPWLLVFDTASSAQGASLAIWLALVLIPTGRV